MTNQSGGTVFKGEASEEEQSPVLDEDRLRDKREILNPKKLRILQQLLANDWGCLSPREVAYRNSDLTESTVRDHLRDLSTRNRPFTTKLVVDKADREEGIPWTYYAVTEYGIELLQEVGVYEGISVLYEMYAELDREDIQEIENFDNRPNPSWI